MPKISRTSGLLDLLSKTTEQDLVELRKEIGELRKHMDALEAVEKLMVIKVYGRPKAGPKKDSTEPTDSKQPTGSAPVKGDISRAYRVKAAEYLIHAGKPVKPSTLCQQCDIPLGSSHVVFAHPWFERSDAGIGLTAEGRKMAG